MRTLAHMSDLHFGRVDPAIVEGLLASLRADAPDLVVVSGDLTQTASHSQFRQARDFLARLPVDHLVIPGNHDIPGWNLLERFTQPLGRYRRYIAREINPSYVDDELAIQCLNTARPLVLSLHMGEGFLLYRQLNRARSFFRAQAQGRFRIVVTHHPFMPAPEPRHRRVVGRATAALRAFEALDVELLLAGHLHQAFSGDVSEHHTFVRRSMLVIQSATTTSTRLRGEENAYNRIVIDGHDSVSVEMMVWNGQLFERVATTAFTRRGQRWIQALPEEPKLIDRPDEKP